MRVPRVKKRRPLEDKKPNGYRESDKDFVSNNFSACVWFLEHRDEIARKLKDAALGERALAQMGNREAFELLRAWGVDFD